MHLSCVYFYEKTAVSTESFFSVCINPRPYTTDINDSFCANISNNYTASVDSKQSHYVKKKFQEKKCQINLLSNRIGDLTHDDGFLGLKKKKKKITMSKLIAYSH